MGMARRFAYGTPLFNPSRLGNLNGKHPGGDFLLSSGSWNGLRNKCVEAGMIGQPVGFSSRITLPGQTGQT